LSLNVSTQIELMLPLRLANGERGSDFQRAQQGLIASVNRFCDPAFVCRLTIVVPQADLDAAAALAAGCVVPVEIISETALLPTDKIGDIPRRGWFVQQMLKLAFCRLCSTPFYVTLDADVFLIKPLNESVFQDGLAPAHYEPVSAHPGWWEASAKTLDFELTAKAFNEAQAFGVTPAFLKTGIVWSMLDRLDTLSGGDWVQYLCARTSLQNNCWTEYSLYWTYLINKHTPETLYYGHPLYLYSHYTWHANRTLADRSMSYPQNFCILQSSQIDDRAYTDFVSGFLAGAAAA